ncbi:MAG: hypothetical protein EP329_21415 [Deltaproteobacteria bacterium]|nr:MAG: hypothetical protein EP329_21415 [Deltaproteobacteria bacterium]
MKRLLSIAIALVALFAAPAAAEDLGHMGVCQDLLGDETACDVDTTWAVRKDPIPDYLLEPHGDQVAYTVTVTEGETRYTLHIGTLIELTGLIADGTQVRGLIISLQKGVEGGYTTVASARYGEFNDDCGCAYIENGQLAVEIRDEAGNIVPAVQESIIEDLAYGEIRYLHLNVTYDLSAGVILPGDPVRIQTCINYASNSDTDILPGCAYDGGSVRTIKACTPFDFDSYVTPQITDVNLEEFLAVIDGAFVNVWGFVAEALTERVTPVGPVELEPGVPTTFQITPTGISGTESVISVTGFAECAPIVTCEAPVDDLCIAHLTNEATLTLGNDTATDSATVSIACTLFGCNEDTCNDQDPCTIDTCVEGVGCFHEPASGLACDDGNPCTSSDTCIAGTCVGGEGTVCPDDGDPCTTSWCDPVAGCVTGWADIGTTCDDGNQCTTDDYCKFGGCWGGTEVVCTTTNTCTEATCNPSIGCVETPRRGPCEDGDPCTVQDYCDAGACVSGTPNPCDDGNDCTADSCHPHSGCVHEVIEGSCEDGDLCTINDTCVAGLCHAGEARTCDDTQCATASCDPTVGCVLTPVDDGKACNNQDDCTGCPWVESNVGRGFDVVEAAVIDGVGLPGDYVVWATGFFGFKAQVRWRAVPGLKLLVYQDGMATLKGQIEVFDTGGAPATTDLVWDFDMTLAFRGVGPEGQGSGGPHIELAPSLQTTAYSDLWLYFDLVSATMHSTTSSNWAELVPRPSNDTYPFQLGERANDRNLNFGAASWFTYTHYYNGDPIVGYGNVNVDLKEQYCNAPDSCVAGQCTSGPPTWICVDVNAGDYCTYDALAFSLSCTKAPDGPGCLIEKNFELLATSYIICDGLSTWAIGFTGLPRIAFSDPTRLRAFIDPYRRGWQAIFSTLYCNPDNLVNDTYVKELAAARLNVDMSDAGVLPAPHNLPFGSLYIASGDCAGRTVRDAVHRAEMVYVGATVDGTTCKDRAKLEGVLQKINASFESCVEMTGYVVKPPTE